jgi:hypothetical protein
MKHKHLKSFLIIAGAIASFSFAATVPVDVTATQKVGRQVIFTVVCDGTQPFTYQWKKEGVAIAGATKQTLDLPSVTAADAGNYTVTVANLAGSCESNRAVLNVTVNPTTAAVSISTP